MWAVGGPLGIDDAYEAADRRYRLESAKKAMDAMIEELDRVILDHCRDEEIFEFGTGTVDVSISASRKRVIDPAVAARIIGPLAQEFAGQALNIGVIDRLLKEKPMRLSSEQASALKQAIRTEYGDARVKTAASDPTAVAI